MHLGYLIFEAYIRMADVNRKADQTVGTAFASRKFCKEPFLSTA